MTETAAMVAAQHPAEFLAGDRSSGRALPHAALEVAAAGQIRISGPSLFQGDISRRGARAAWLTEDVGRLDAAGRAPRRGPPRRADHHRRQEGRPAGSRSGAAGQRCAEFDDVAVIGIPDTEWGQRVVACYPAAAPAPNLERVDGALAVIAAHKHPRRFIPIAEWPRNAQGELSRRRLFSAAINCSPYRLRSCRRRGAYGRLGENAEPAIDHPDGFQS